MAKWVVSWYSTRICRKKLKKTRSIQRTQTPPRLWPLHWDRDLLTRSWTLRSFNIKSSCWKCDVHLSLVNTFLWWYFMSAKIVFLIKNTFSKGFAEVILSITIWENWILSPVSAVGSRACSGNKIPIMCVFASPPSFLSQKQFILYFSLMILGIIYFAIW